MRGGKPELKWPQPVFHSISHPCHAQKVAQGSGQIRTQAPERYGGDFRHVAAEAVGWPGAPVVWAWVSVWSARPWPSVAWGPAFCKDCGDGVPCRGSASAGKTPPVLCYCFCEKLPSVLSVSFFKLHNAFRRPFILNWRLFILKIMGVDYNVWYQEVIVIFKTCLQKNLWYYHKIS